MIDQTDHSANNKQTTTHLYLCDGKACPEDDKKFCYTQGNSLENGVCRHTTNENHSFSKILKGLIPTKFYPFSGNDHILVEYFDYDATIDKDLFNSFLKKKTESDSNNAKS